MSELGKRERMFYASLAALTFVAFLLVALRSRQLGLAVESERVELEAKHPPVWRK